MRAELPPLAEIVSSDEPLKYSSLLTIPELLIVGANIVPGKSATSRDPRSEEEVRRLSQRANRQIHKLSVMADTILRELMKVYFENPPTTRHSVTDYYGKHELLVAQAKQADPGALNHDTLDSIRQFKRRMATKGSHNGPSKEARNLQKTPVNLTYFEPRYKAGFITIGKKIKVPERIAHKLPYCIIRSVHEENGVANARSFYNHLSLEDGLIKDIVGLQIVLPNLDSVVELKEHITQSDNLEVLKLDDYIRGKTGDYQAIHLAVLYNPRNKTNGNNMHRLKDSVEIIITDARSYFTSNFGPVSYYRRSQAQKKGIVFKERGRSGSLRVMDFKPYEMAWKQEFEKRVYEILTYNIAAGLRR